MCNATGYPILWSNTSNLIVSHAMIDDTGIYECVATNGVDTDMRNATVTVQS